eukprot:Em0002g276a
MEGIQLKPPEQFDFKRPDGWNRWKRRFEQYRVASGLAESTEERQVCTLLYCLGEDAENVLSSTNIKAEERKKYDVVVQKFDAFFTVRRNVIFERARFNRRSQLDGESAEQYITTLYALAENCDYKNWKDEMIRDRLVVGIRDSVLSERMQMDPDLTLENAKKMVRQKEAVKEQQLELKCDAGGTHESNMDTVKLQSKERGKYIQEERSASKCHRCGKRAHPLEHCPAKDVRCSSCHRLGHFAAHCCTRGLQSMQQESDSSTAMDSAYLAVVGQESSWIVDIQLCGRNLKFKLDTAIEGLKLVTRMDTISDYSSKIMGQFPKLFQGLGNVKEPYHIQLKPNSRPYALYTARNVPFALRDKVKEELRKMEEAGVISRVDEPTEWCAGMVVAPKKNGSVRICVDLRPLNECVLREIHPIPMVDETLALLSGAQLFSKLDANNGFWQVPLTEESRRLTTFITPNGRFYFNKLPFGICSAPEHFQRVMSRILSGLEGVKSMTGGSQQYLRTRLETAGVTLNKDKCSFGQESLKFLGHVIDKEGIRPDPDKTAAIWDMPAPQNISYLRRFMGMVTQLGKFTPNLAELSQPLRDLLSSKRAWNWGPSQREAFSLVKMELSKPSVLAHYSPTARVKVTANASSHGLGAVLTQLNKGEWRPVTFASRSMTETERRYAQIEKEALAVTWACEKFRDYVLGRNFDIETDHKPLVPILSSKQLNSLPPRVLRFRLRLMHYSYSITHVPGKLLYTADTLSRAPTTNSPKDLIPLQEEAEVFIDSAIQCLPTTGEKLKEFSASQASDAVCSQVMKYCQFGWPDKHRVTDDIKPYWTLRGYLTVHNGLLLYGRRIVIPVARQREILEKIHQGHLGIQRCRLRIMKSVWWPGVSAQMDKMIRQCHMCAKEAVAHKEPMIAAQLPTYPWQKIGSDLFELNGTTYMLVVDYFSRYIEVVKVTVTSSMGIIEKLKPMFSRQGIPEVLVSDNGPQYSSHEMKEFAQIYGFTHITSSPRYPQSNGQAERAVQTVKKLLRTSGDLYLSVLNYNATPMPWCGFSPSELLMGRKVRTTVPQVAEQFCPNWPFLDQFYRKNQEFKKQQEKQYNRRHQTRPQLELEEGDEVWINTDSKNTRGYVTSPANTPRSYVVDTPAGQLRRNRSHLTIIPSPADEPTDSDDTESTATQEVLPEATAGPEQAKETVPLRSPVKTQSQTGTSIRPPIRYRGGGDVV